MNTFNSLLLELSKHNVNGVCPTLFDKTNFDMSVKLKSIIILKESDYATYKHIIPINSLILLANVNLDQMSKIENNIKFNNISNSVGTIIYNLDKFIISFMKSHQYPIYEVDDSYHFNQILDDNILWNAFENVKINIQMINNNNVITWIGIPHKGTISEGMEWIY